MDTVVVYIENENKHINFIQSLNMLNVPHHRLLEGGEWPGMFNKMQVYIDGLNEINNEWVILSDARDVLFYKDIETINNVYTKYYSDFDIITQAEDNADGCDAFKPYYKKGIRRFEFGDTDFKYVCAGLIMGKRSVLLNFFEEILKKLPPMYREMDSDQPAIEWGMGNLSYKIGLDSDCRLFQQMTTNSVFNGKPASIGTNFHLHFNKNFIKNTKTNTEPCIFHGSGGTFLHQVWKIINKKY
jgi:hypothetical protein